MLAKRHLFLPAAFVLTSLATLVAGQGVGGAQEEPPVATAPSASVDKVGWWNRTQGPQEGEPDNPLRPVLAPVPAPPTNVPANSVGVGAALGDPTKVAAVGVLLEADAGATVDTLTLTLKESPDPGANVASDQAAIVACPITAFWGDTRNGNWIDRPQADCTQGSAAGKRAADGTWTFDLAALAPLWLDPDGPGQNGVLLMESVDAPGGFEASFLDPASGGMTLAFSATGGEGASDAFGETTGSEASGASDLGLAAGDVGRSDTFSLSPSPVGAPTGGAATPSRGATSSAGGGTGAAGQPVSAPRSADLVGNLSGLTYLLIPGALALAVLLSLVLGATAGGETPAAPTSTRRRQGGVARALARRERAQPLAPHP